MNFLSQMLGNMTQVWLNVAFIACVFAVLMFKRERIVNVALFRTACVLFTLSLIAPSVGLFLLSTVAEAASPMARKPFGEITVSMKVVNLLAPLLFAGAFMTAVSSMIPSPTSHATGPDQS